MCNDRGTINVLIVKRRIGTDFQIYYTNKFYEQYEGDRLIDEKVKGK